MQTPQQLSPYEGLHCPLLLFEIPDGSLGAVNADFQVFCCFTAFVVLVLRLKGGGSPKPCGWLTSSGFSSMWGPPLGAGGDQTAVEAYYKITSCSVEFGKSGSLPPAVEDLLQTLLSVTGFRFNKKVHRWCSG